MIDEALKQSTIDVPRALLGHLNRRTVHAKIVATESGVVAGMEALEDRARALALHVTPCCVSGSRVVPGSIVAMVAGSPEQIVRGEDYLLGTIAKVSGIATAAHAAVCRAGRLRVVCGGWKKMPAVMKQDLRSALRAGGLEARIVQGPFLYLDKNYVRILGTIGAALDCAGRLPDRTVVIQLRGETAAIAEEAAEAARRGARVLMVDTGRIDDLRAVSAALHRDGLRQRVELAFAGNLTPTDLDQLQGEDVDVVDIGRAILDAPLLDYRYDVFELGVGDDVFSFAGHN